MTEREMIQDAMAKIARYRETVSPKEQFAQMVAQGIINKEGEVLVTKEERAAGHPIENGALNEPGTK